MTDETQATGTRKTPQWGRWLCLVVVFAVLVAIGAAVVRLIPVTYRYYTDADTIKTPLETAPTRDILWQPPKRLADIINTADDDYEPRASADGLTLYFVRGKAGENADIYLSRRTYEGWTPPQPLIAVNTKHEDLGPEPSADGESLYFYSDRPGGLGGYDIWVAHRSRDGWQPPINLGPLVNSEFNDYGPAVTPDGKTLYFSSNRPQPDDRRWPDPNAWPATIREDLFHRDYDLYTATVTDRGFGQAQSLMSLNSPYNEGAPAVSSFGDFLYFASDRPGGEGGFDLYRSHRWRGEHRPAEDLGPPINTRSNELDPGLGLGGYALFFSSDAPAAPSPAGQPPPEMPREYNLYYTTSREVFPEVDRVPRAPIDWTALWKAVLPNLLWALLALLALLLLLALLRDVRGRRLSLLAKCLLASLMVHLLLMLLFNTWEVTATMAREFRRGGRIRIALASPAGGDALTRQIRGQLTDVETPTPVEMTHRRQAAPVEIQTSATVATLSVPRGTIEMAEDLAPGVPTTDATVRERAAAPPVPEVSSDTRSNMPLDMSLPTEQPRVRTTEPVASAQTSPLDTPPPKRPTVTVAASQPVEAADEMAQVPSSYDASEASRNTQTLAAASPGHDADLLPAPAMIDTASMLASARVPRMTDVPLPQPPVDRIPETTEITPRIMVPATAALRYGLPEGTLSPAPTGHALMLAPEPGEVKPRNSTFAPMPTDHAVDVSPSHASVDRGGAPTPEPAVPPLTGFVLADLETVPASTATESPLQPVHQTAAPPRRDLPADASITARYKKQALIEPPTLAAEPDGSSLAVRPEQHVTEATPSDVRHDAGRTPQPQPSMPRPTDLDLSTPDTRPANAATESPIQPTARTTDRLRPHLSPSATPGPNHEVQASVSPQRVNTVPEASSLATSAGRHADDASPRRFADNTATVPHAEGVLPAPLSFTLPNLEQSTALHRDEPAPDIAWALSGTPRASITEPLTPPEHVVSDSTFDVPRTPGQVSERDPSTSLAGLPARDSSVDPMALAGGTPSTTRDLVIPRTPGLSFDLPAEVVPPSNPYAQRSAPDRLTIVERLGGSTDTERAVAAALDWLARHQSEDGHWDGLHFDDRCRQCDGQTDIAVNRALTGLALLGFYGAGHTHVAEGPYRDTIERGLRWLLDRRQPDGDLRGEETMYTQGIVTIVFSEAFGMTRDTTLAEPVRLAVRFIDRARNTRVGGWRYDPGQVGDTSVLGWQVMALKSASLNGVATPAASFKAAREWLDLVSNPVRPGRYAYQPGRGYTPAMTAEGMFSQQLLGLSRDDPRMQASAAFLADHPPDWESAPNTYYWYYGTLAMFQHQGDGWRDWNNTLTRQLLKHQRQDAPAAGSWDPRGEWADIGGRVYQTAMCTLMLEVYYRYLPLYTLDGNVAPIGAIRGLVSDASTGSAIPGAAVRLVLPDREPVSATTGMDGGYTLSAPAVPDFFALSASMDGYVPSTANVDSATVQGTTLAVDFQLTPVNLAVIAIEPVPDVHHLGDDNFDGAINSQFQKRSEGSTFAAEFQLSAAQLPPHFNRAEVTLLAKGVQRSHNIRINGTEIDQRLDDAPPDGSFGEFTAPLDISILRSGANTMEIIARPSTTDIDDFEFVNIQIRLTP